MRQVINFHISNEYICLLPVILMACFLLVGLSIRVYELCIHSNSKVVTMMFYIMPHAYNATNKAVKYFNHYTK